MRIGEKKVGEAIKDIKKGQPIKKRDIGATKVSLRPAITADCELLWNLRNDPNVRESAFETGFIPYEHHVKWFNKRLNSEDVKIFIVQDQNLRPVGQIRFDIGDDGCAEIDISINSAERGKGYGTTALKKACVIGLEDLHIKKFVAHIKTGNKASILVFSKAGFSRAGTKKVNGSVAVEMCLENIKELPVDNDLGDDIEDT
ncbi:MAG: GNAT family N-acetyltransferase [bacterium]